MTRIVALTADPVCLGLRGRIDTALGCVDALASGRISVTVSRNAVSIAGTVGSVEEASEATARAWSTHGVREVRARLRVDPQQGGR